MTHWSSKAICGHTPEDVIDMKLSMLHIVMTKAVARPGVSACCFLVAGRMTCCGSSRAQQKCVGQWQAQHHHAQGMRIVVLDRLMRCCRGRRSAWGSSRGSLRRRSAGMSRCLRRFSRLMLLLVLTATTPGQYEGTLCSWVSQFHEPLPLPLPTSLMCSVNPSQERQNAERRIQHLEASSSATRQELNAARLAGIADRQRDGCQISSLKAQVEGHAP